MGSENEVVAIVDEQNNPVGTALRREMRALRLPHRATYILVFNSHEQLFVHKRTPTKDIFPGCWDVVAGGVTLAGETYEACAERELAEELGIRHVPLNFLFEFYYTDQQNRVWGRAYSCVYDLEIALDKKEVAEGSFLEIREVLQMADHAPFTPDSLYVLRRYLAETPSGRRIPDGEV